MKQAYSKDRIIFLDVLRIIAAFAVVLLHVSSQRFNELFLSDEWIVRMVYDALVRWSVPVFVMISGALFLDESKKINVRKLYSKNITKIICIFLFWSVIYTLYDGFDLNNPAGFLARIVNGPFHFWFLKMLIGLYVAVPILRAIASRRYTERYFIFIAFIAAFIVSLLFPVIGFISSPTKQLLESVYNSIDIKFVSGYVGLFVLGHYLNNYQLKPNITKLIYLVGFLSFIVVCSITYFISCRTGLPNTRFYDGLNILTVLEATAVFLFFKNISIPTRYHSWIINVSKASLGIYLIHVLLIHVANDFFKINSSFLNPVFFIPIFSLIVFFVSYVIISFLMRIPIIKRFVS